MSANDPKRGSRIPSLCLHLPMGIRPRLERQQDCFGSVGADVSPHLFARDCREAIVEPGAYAGLHDSRPAYHARLLQCMSRVVALSGHDPGFSVMSAFGGKADIRNAATLWSAQNRRPLVCG
jgi:hypothetical protein